MTYPLHIILRFNLEQKIFNDEIKINDIPELWNYEYKKLFNKEVDIDTNLKNFGNKFNVTIFNVRSRFIKELPLFFGVLLGNLSLVGSTMFETTEPNPDLICQPGLTGLERIRSIKFSSKDRLALDHYYVQNQSFTMDLEIIMKTVFSN